MKSSYRLRETENVAPKLFISDEDISYKIEELEINTRIPSKYHIIQTFPVFPSEYSGKGYKIYFRDGKWNVVLWPSNTSNYKDEIHYLDNAVQKMLDEIEVFEDNPEDPDNSKLNIVIKKAELVKIAMEELNRQITRENSERGILLGKLINLFVDVLNDIPNIYSRIIIAIKNQHEKEICDLQELNNKLTISVKSAVDELKSQKVLFNMQNQWHNDLEEQIDSWKESVSSFNDRLQYELNKIAVRYDNKISNLKIQLQSVISERDGYRNQIDWEGKNISLKEAEIITIRQQLEETKNLLSEREQTLCATKAHFERQFMFMREQINQLTRGNTIITSNVSKITAYIPPEHDSHLPYLDLSQTNIRIMEIYTAKIRHDFAYNEPTPLYTFIIKYHIAKLYGYKNAVPVIWQFIRSCEKHKHESVNVSMFLNQIEEQTSNLNVIMCMAYLVQNEPKSEIGLPRLSVQKCVEIGKKLIPELDLNNLQMLCSKKVVNPRIDQSIDFDHLVNIIVDLYVDLRHTEGERLMCQFRELLAGNNDVDWVLFSNFVSRLSPEFSSQYIGDLFLDVVKDSLPNTSITEKAFQMLVNRGSFEKFRPAISDDFEVSNPEDVASFVNINWKNKFAEVVHETLVELKTEKQAECHRLFAQLSAISDQMKMSCSVADAAFCFSQLHLAAILLIRYKFLKIARRDAFTAQKQIDRVLDVVFM